MKIVSQTSQRLEIEKNSLLSLVPWFILCTCFFILVLVSLYDNFYYKLECRRFESNQVNCSLTSMSLVNTKIISIKSLKKVEITTEEVVNTRTRRTTYSHSVYLVTDNEKISVGIHLANAKKIEAFLKNFQESELIIEQDTGKPYELLIFVSFLLGLCFLYSINASIFDRVILDKSLGKLKIKRRAIVRKYKNKSYNLSEVSNLYVIDKKLKAGTYYNLAIVLNHKKQIVLFYFYYYNRAEVETIAATLKDFLDLKG